MGLFDSILGRSKPPEADLDALFAVPQAALSLGTDGFTATGVGGVCYRPTEGGAFSDTEAQIKQLVATGGGPQIEGTTDRFGFRWLTVTRTDADVSGLVTDLHAINASLADAGFGSALLCSTVVFTTPDEDTHGAGLPLQARHVLSVRARDRRAPRQRARAAGSGPHSQ